MSDSQQRLLWRSAHKKCSSSSQCQVNLLWWLFMNFYSVFCAKSCQVVIAGDLTPPPWQSTSDRCRISPPTTGLIMLCLCILTAGLAARHTLPHRRWRLLSTFSARRVGEAVKDGNTSFFLFFFFLLLPLHFSRQLPGSEQDVDLLLRSILTVQRLAAFSGRKLRLWNVDVDCQCS